MKNLVVIQHTSSEYLGLIEDHFEARGIRFSYFRPFAQGGGLPHRDLLGDGLVLLGGGPWGSAGTRDLPTLAEEIVLARVCLMTEKPLVGFGLGAQIVARASDGSSESDDYRLAVQAVRRVRDDALAGLMPARFDCAECGRDRAVPPGYADVLAVDEEGRPAVFQVGPRAIGFAGHPGFKPAIAEDLIMEFEESPVDGANGLLALRAAKSRFEDALVPIMAGLTKVLGLGV
ncbi:MAG: hypothetical protein R3D57_20265 [Hyphomicrobiaceae bacterium]